VDDAVTALRDRFKAAGYKVGELVFPANLTTLDARISQLTARVWPTPEGFYFDNGEGPVSVTYTSSVPGTVVEVVYSTYSAPFVVTIDGIPHTVTPPNTEAGTLYATFTGLPDTQHTVVLTTPFSGYVAIAAVGVRYPTGVVLMNAATSGSHTDGIRHPPVRPRRPST
jgi:hypothetical protein